MYCMSKLGLSRNGSSMNILFYSSKKMLELFHLLQSKHRESESELFSESEVLSRYSLHNARTDSASGVFYSDCSVNPLGLPLSLLCKNVLKKN